MRNISTDALIDTVANYPFLIDMFAFSSLTNGYTALKSSFNGLSELVSRSDGAKCLLDYYNNLMSRRNSENFIVQAAIEAFLLQPEVSTQLAPYGYSLYSSGSTERAITKFYPIILPTASAVLNWPTTPSGGSITDGWCIYTGSDSDYPDYSITERNAINNDIKNSYGLDPVSKPTVKYNCHSYAWWSQSPSNLWWISYPDDFLNDNFVSRSQSISVNDRLVYQVSYDGEYQHSAIVVAVSQGSGSTPPITVISKWGSLGVYRHNVYNCPSSYGTIITPYRISK